MTDLVSTAVGDADFAFNPFKQDTIGGATAVATTLDGMIGDRIWLDTDANGVLSIGEGMEGVSVRLYASGGVNLLASTVTDENGQYYFAGLNPTSSYVVQVQTATLPYTGLTNFVDPDGGTASAANVTLTNAAPVNLAQDFGYRDSSSPNTIAGTLWNDLDADGTLDGTEPDRFQGVNIQLLNDAGTTVSKSSTNASGGFSFANLPDGSFQVDVSEQNPGLTGFWKSNGSASGGDNNSQPDPYPVPVSDGQTNSNADFGFFQKPASLGNYIWIDDNSDGIQDVDEFGLENWPISLTITWPDFTTTILRSITNAGGFFNFGNLLQDERYDGVGSPEPSFTLKSTLPTYYLASPANQGGDDALDFGRHDLRQRDGGHDSAWPACDRLSPGERFRQSLI